MPIILDLESWEIIYTDLWVNAQENYNNVEGSLDTVSIITREVTKIVKTKPSFYDLALFHSQAKGLKIVEEEEKSDIIFWVKEWTYNLFNTEKLMNELL